MLAATALIWDSVRMGTTANVKFLTGPKKVRRFSGKWGLPETLRDVGALAFGITPQPYSQNFLRLSRGKSDYIVKILTVRRVYSVDQTFT